MPAFWTPVAFQFTSTRQWQAYVAFLLPGISVSLRAPIPRPDNELGDGLPARLRRRRRELGLTAREAAARLGANEWTYGNWEKGENQPTDRFYPAIISFLGYEPWPEPVTIGERLQAERRRRGLAVGPAATRNGLDEGTWLRWESGEWNVHSRRCRKIVDAFFKGAP